MTDVITAPAPRRQVRIPSIIEDIDQAIREAKRYRVPVPREALNLMRCAKDALRNAERVLGDRP